MEATSQTYVWTLMSPQDSGVYRNFQKFHSAGVEHANPSVTSSPKAGESRVGPHLSCIRHGAPLFRATHKLFATLELPHLLFPKLGTLVLHVWFFFLL